MKIMFLKKGKGAANLFSYFLFIFVSIAVLSTVIYMVQDTIKKNEEKYKFDEMIKNINNIQNTIENVSKSRFSSREIVIYNPDTLEIDCQENIIKGEIEYNQNIRSDVKVVITDIEVYKENNRAYFKRIISENNDVNIDCNSIYFNKGKTKYLFKYQDYNFEEKKIILNIELLDFNRSETQ